MKPGKPSSTAGLVAALRSLSAYMPASSGLPTLIGGDPYGIDLAGAPWTWLRPLATSFPRSLSLALTAGFGSLTARVALRTRVIDDAVRSAVAKGATQVLILGAGLDARAVRLLFPSGESPKFFEVDFPASQKYKLAKVAEFYPPAEREKASKEVSYISADLCAKEAHTTMAHALVEAGFDTTKKSVVLLEGLVPYLNESDVIATLDALAGLTAPGSTLILHHITAPPAGHHSLSLLTRLRIAPFLLYLRWASEPLRFFGWKESQIGPALEARGFRLEDDTSASQHARRLGLPPSTQAAINGGGWGKWEERIAVAERFRRPEAHVGSG